MKEEEQAALQKCHLSLVRDLDIRDILPNLFQYGMISSEEYEDFDSSSETQMPRCRRFLRAIARPESKCSFQGFVQSLRDNDVYTFLADILEQALEEVLRNENSVIIDEETGKNEQANDIIYEPVRKINVFTERRKAISSLAHKLKRLSHDGEIERFQKVVKAIDTKFKRNKLNMTESVSKRMELADMRFAALEASISAKRVQYDKSVGDGDMFRHLESVIPFTSNPRVSSMSYLARYGSGVAMTTSVDDGLAYIQFAKEHAEHVTPCKETGMVYYIEVNLLSQNYEKEPTHSLKENILKTTEKGIAQFSGENDEVKKDYQRMLLLKKVFCYLGIGLFCKKIEEAETTAIDLDEAKNVIDFIETSDIWHGMEKRRKMLFYVAKSEFYKQKGNLDLAVVHAKEAKQLGVENNWGAELLNISELVIKLEQKPPPTKECKDISEVDLLAELFGDLSDFEGESEENRDDTSSSLPQYFENTQLMNLKQMKVHDNTEENPRAISSFEHSFQPTTDSEYAVQVKETIHTQMMNLKESVEETFCGETNDQAISLLKEHDIGQLTENSQFKTEQGYSLNMTTSKADDHTVQFDLQKLGVTSTEPCMSFLKPHDYNNGDSDFQFSIVKDQSDQTHQIGYPSQPDSDLSNDLNLLLLKDNDFITEPESEISLMEDESDTALQQSGL